MANDTPVPLNRIERILRNMFVSAAAVSVLAIVAVIVASLLGAETDGGAWLTLRVVPFIGFAFAVVLLIVFAVVSIPRRRRLERDGG